MTLWCDKYRPDKIENLFLDPMIKDIMLKYIDDQLENLPHFIFNGNPGTGKTSLARILYRTFKKTVPDLRFEEINSSNNSGGFSILEKLSDIFKDHTPVIIFLDEADDLQNSNQQHILTYMSKYLHATDRTVVFILSCNDETKLIDAFKTVTTSINFAKIKTSDLEKYAIRILEKEKVTFTQSAIKKTVRISGGDFRILLMMLQICSGSDNHISDAAVDEINGSTNDSLVEIIIKLCRDPNVKDLEIYEKVTSMMDDGFPFIDIISAFKDYFSNSSDNSNVDGKKGQEICELAVNTFIEYNKNSSASIHIMFFCLTLRRILIYEKQ